MELTKEEFEAWKANPVTREVFRRLGFLKKALELALGNGSTLNSENASATQSATALTVGQVRGLNELLEADFDKIDGYAMIEQALKEEA